MDPKRAIELYRDRFANAADFTFVIVGNVDLERLAPLVETYLGGLPSNGRKETFRDIKVRTVKGPVDKRYFAGKEAKSRVEIIFHDDVTYSRADDEDLAALAQAIEYRLRDRLREQLGSTYSISVSGGQWQWPHGQMSFQIYFDCAPTEADQLRKITLDEIDKARRDGFDAETVTKLRNERRRSFETNRKENDYWMRELVDRISHHDDPRAILAIDERVERLTAARLAALAVRYLTPKTAVTATLMPEASRVAQAKVPAQARPAGMRTESGPPARNPAPR